MPWNDNLIGQALNIASSNDSPLRVMAGPGTGKSYSMMRRIQRFLEEGVSPERILAITFTRTAAADIIKELSGMEVTGCERVNAGTLHSYCYKVLMKNDVLQYLGRFPRPLLTYTDRGIIKFEASPLVVDLQTQGLFGNKRDISKRLRAFEAAWARLQSDIPGWPIDTTDNEFHRHLIDWLKFHEGMLIGEIINETLRYFRNNPTCQELNSFDHIIVDEYQDLNKAEQVLIDLLSQNCKCVVVGDVDQSIYSFRHAHPEGITEFNTTHPGTHDEPLTECRRCPKGIVKVADFLIRHNHPAEVSVRLVEKSSNTDGELNIVQWETIDEEADGLSLYVKYLIEQRGYGKSDILILTPRRLLAYRMQASLNVLSIDSHCFYYDEIIENHTGQLAITLLSLLCNINDKVSLRFWLGCDSSTWLVNQYKKLRLYCETNNLSPVEVLEKLRHRQIRISNTNNIQSRYQQLLDQLDNLRTMNIRQLVDFLFPEEQPWTFPVRNVILPQIDNIDGIDKLHQKIRNILTNPELPAQGDFVKIMSLHKSKGLTNKIVIIPSSVLGFIPTIGQDLTFQEREEHLKEQRRLFYVAITRATDILTISSMRTIPLDMAYAMGAIGARREGSNLVTRASQFISELGPDAPPTRVGSVWQNNNFS